MINRKSIIFLVLLIGIVIAGCTKTTQDIIYDNNVEERRISNLETTDVLEESSGILNSQMEETYSFLLEPEYDFISNFDGEYAYVCKDDIYSIINKQGQIIFTLIEYDISAISEGMICIQSKKDDEPKYGLMDMQQNIILFPTYDKPLSFSEGLAFAVSDDKMGYINKDGDIIIDFEYEWGTSFYDGMATVKIEDQFWFLSPLNEIMSGPYDFLGSETFLRAEAYMVYSEGLTGYYEKNSENTFTDYFGNAYWGGGYWGFLDRNGEVAIPADYLEIHPFKEGLAAVLAKENEWIYIDKDNNKVMDGMPADFSNGLAVSRSQVINKQGEVVIEFNSNIAIESGSTFEHGLLIISKSNDTIVEGNADTLFDMNDTYCILNTQGDILFEIFLPSEYDRPIYILSDTLLLVKIDEKWGIIELDYYLNYNL